MRSRLALAFIFSQKFLHWSQADKAHLRESVVVLSMRLLTCVYYEVLLQPIKIIFSLFEILILPHICKPHDIIYIKKAVLLKNNFIFQTKAAINRYVMYKINKVQIMRTSTELLKTQHSNTEKIYH